jgi:hypothetical protein
MIRNSEIYICSLFLACILASCKTDNSNTIGNANFTDSIAIVKDSSTVTPSSKFDMVISDIPFPFEILDNLYSNKIPFNKEVMNNVSNAAKYNQYNSRALNLGIYGADLSYAVTYEQFQEIGAYLKSTKKLAEDLNIPLAFDNNMMEKCNKYKDNKDSLTRIVYDSYNQVDKSLKDDERVGIAALVVTGSWLEGLYISTKTYLDAPRTTENNNLYKVIGGQKQSLIIVIKLLQEYKEDPYFQGLITELDGITSEYNNITTNNIINESQLFLINMKIEKLRKRIINGL